MADIKVVPGKPKFINLRTHTTYSIGLGVGNIKEYVKAAQDKRHAGLAVTDYMSMAASYKAIKAAKEAGYSAIIGLHANVTESIRGKDVNNKYNRIMLFAKNEAGYRKLSRLLSLASVDDGHFYYKPRMALAEVLSLSNVVVSSGDVNSYFGYLYEQGEGAEEEAILKFKEKFGDDFYIEICLADMSKRWAPHANDFVPEDFDRQELFNKRMLELSKKHNIKAYVSAPSFMPDPSYHKVQDVIMAAVTGGKATFKFHEPQYLLTVEEMRERKNKLTPFITDEEFDKMCEVTLEIHAKCKDISLNFAPSLPIIKHREHPVWDRADLNEKLDQMRKTYLDEPITKILAKCDVDDATKLAFLVMLDNGKKSFEDREVRDRIAHEIKVLQWNGIAKLIDYFFLIEDVVRNVIIKQKKMKGYCRGSSGSSLLNYMLDITDLDPLRWGLPFSRFNTIERNGMMIMEMEGYSLKDVLSS